MPDRLFWTLVVIIMLGSVVTAIIIPIAAAFPIVPAVTLGYIKGCRDSG